MEFNALGQREVSSEEAQDKARSLLRDGRALMESGEVEAAEEVFVQAELEVGAPLGGARFNRALLALEADRPDLALTLLLEVEAFEGGEAATLSMELILDSTDGGSVQPDIDNLRSLLAATVDAGATGALPNARVG